MNEEYKVEKSRLCNEQTKELKVLAKELKKKKGNPRNLLEKKVEEIKERHEQELAELAKKCGCSETKKIQIEQPNNVLYYFPDHNWSSLGKKELEAEAVKRGLGKKGNREELVTKLTIFGTDQKKKIEEGLIDPKNVYSDGKETGQKMRKAVDTSSSSDEDDEDPQPTGPRNQFVKNSVGESKKVCFNSRDDSSSEVTSNSDDDDDDDIPDADKLKGSAKEDQRGVHKRSAATARRGGRGGRGGGSGRGGRPTTNSNDIEPPQQLSPEERERKRERLMQQVLIKMLNKKPEGISMDDVGLELRRLNVKNFRAELLGYESVEEWICHQPSHVLYYDPEKRKLFPNRIDTLPDEE